MPEEALSKMKTTRADTLYRVVSPCGYILTPQQEDIENQIKVAEKIMKLYKNTLRELDEDNLILWCKEQCSKALRLSLAGVFSNQLKCLVVLLPYQ